MAKTATVEWEPLNAKPGALLERPACKAGDSLTSWAL